MSKPVMSVVSPLRPFWRFEYYYGLSGGAAVPGSRPIRLQPVNPVIPAQPNALPPVVDQYAYDQAARQAVNGYSTKLGAMAPVPAIGSTVLVYLPQIPYLGEAGGQVASSFMYAFVPVWRLRTLADWKRFRKPGSMPLERFGAPDSTGGTQANRYILPSARGATLYMRPEPVTATGAASPIAITVAYPEAVGMPTGPNSSTWSPPFGPVPDVVPVDNIQHTQQGIIDMGLTGYAGGQPFFRPYWIKTCGNELAFDVYKIAIPSDGEYPNGSEVQYVDWDFRYNNAGGSIGYCDGPGDGGGAGEDLAFSIVFGMGAKTSVAGNANYGGAFPWSGVYLQAGIT